MLEETKLPPQNIDSEKNILGAIIVDEDKLHQAMDSISADDFYNITYRIIYKVISELYKKGKNVNILSLKGKLTDNEKLREIGGVSYLAALCNIYVNPYQFKECINSIKETAKARSLIKLLADTSAQAYDNVEIDNVLADLQSKIVNITNSKDEGSNIKDLIRELSDVQIEYSEKYESGEKYIGIPTGFNKLDDAIDGLREGHLWLCGGWTSTGKTFFSLNVVSNVLKLNIPVSIVSLEMTGVDTISRIIGIRLNISSMKVLKGKMEKELWNEIEREKDILYKSPLWVHTTKFQLDKIKSTIRKDVYKNKVKLVVIDYVQNIFSDSGNKEYDLMTRSAKELQALAKELKITIYIVSQISNEAEKGQGAGAGFKGSGALEASADIAIRLKRDKSSENELFEIVPVDVIISKNRHGFTGISKYNMTLKSGKFEEVNELTNVEDEFNN